MDNSPFRKLPPELRVQIFEYALYSPHETGVFEWDDKGPKLVPWMTAEHRQALTMVCTQIRAECFPLFYRFDRLRFSPLILNKFQPGFFVTGDNDSQEMMWKYLGPLGNWLERFSSWLEHMGDGIRNNINDFEIHVGTWKRTWSSLENPLIARLTKDLASVVKLFESTHTQVHLCLQLEAYEIGSSQVTEVSLPISNMVAAHETLDECIERGKDLTPYRYPYLRAMNERQLDAGRDVICAYLHHLDECIKRLPES